MTIFDFVLEKKKQLKKYSNYWQRNHLKNPPCFPMNMDYQEFDEQFDFFVENISRGENNEM